MDPINGLKLKAFFLTNSVVSNIAKNEVHHSTLQFTDLVKTCGIDITLAETLPNNELITVFDLIFIDLQFYILTDNIPIEIQQLTSRVRVVFFNATDNLCDEKQLLISSIAGIFYQGERIDIILRGITRLQKNERWFKRKTMNSALSELLVKVSKLNQLPANQQQQSISLPSLTRRENTIIGLVSRGAKNQEIADQLHISPNTVKTHLYSIFRKTQSRNRIELISRTQDYLFTAN
jgi:DNA-binding NarL/FixJ family response regulator